MRIQTIDQSGHEVVLDNFPDGRHAVLDGFVRGIAPHLELRANDMEPISHLVGQLAFLETEARMKEYEPRKYQRLLDAGCITSEAGEWAEVVNYRIKDRSGKGRRIHPNTTVMPMANTATSQSAVSIAEGGIGYSYSLQQLRASARQGSPLPADDQQAAVEGHLDHLDDVALKGEAESNFKGLFNHGSIDHADRASGAVWDSATADTILSDINILLGNVYTKSKTIHPPARLVLPPSRMTLLMKPRNTASDTMILTYIKRNNLYTLETGTELDIVAGTSFLETAGNAGGKRALAYTPKPDNVKFHIPMPQRFGAPQLLVNMVNVYSEYRYGGLDFGRVYTAEYMDAL